MVQLTSYRLTWGDNVTQSEFPPCFHLATLVDDLDAARHFYGDLLGCVEGRATDHWVDFNFFGHQLSLHLGNPPDTNQTSKVGQHDVPMPHFGAVLPKAQFETLAARLNDANIAFILPPVSRFVGEPGEQSTMFFKDPAGNCLEIKTFTSADHIFER